MISKKTFIAVDLGAESGRVLAGEFDGRSLELRVVHSFSNGPVDLNGSIHWNVIGLYNEILIGLSKSQVKYGSSIQSIGVDSWGLITDIWTRTVICSVCHTIIEMKELIRWLTWLHRLSVVQSATLEREYNRFSSILFSN